MLGWMDIILRLGGATLIGCAIGLNRELHHKATGMRTLGLVALGSALAVLGVAQDFAGGCQQGHPRRHHRYRLLGRWRDFALPHWGKGAWPHDCRDNLGHSISRDAVRACRVADRGCRDFSMSFLLIAGGPIEKWCHKRLGSDEQSGSAGET